MQNLYQTRRNWGFTLLEIMIVVSIIGMLAVIAVPNYLRGRKRAQATQVLSELRQLDHAIQLYLIENNKTEATPFVPGDALAYVKDGTRLAESQGKDMFGNDFIVDLPDRIPKINPTTFALLSEVAPRSFWSPHIQ